MIDDIEINCHEVRTFLDDELYLMEYSTDPLEGIRQIKEDIPDLIILDISMDKLDGYGVIKKLKQNEKTRHIPIIIFSIIGHTDATKLRSLGLGIEHVVHSQSETPLQVLEAYIENCLAKRNQRAVRVFRVGKEHTLKVIEDADCVLYNEYELALSFAQRRVLTKLSKKEGGYIQSDTLRKYLYHEVLNDIDWKFHEKNNLFRFIHGLRKRVEPDPKKPIFIKNVRGVGYYLDGYINTTYEKHI